MAMAFSSACIRWKGCKGCAIVAILFLISSFSKGFNIEETQSLPSSPKEIIKPNISIQISETIKYTTTDRIKMLNNNKNDYASAVITSTHLLPDNFHIKIIKEMPIKLETYETNTENTWKENTQSEIQSADYYNVIIPTKTVSERDLTIMTTKILNEKSSGEGKGVSMKISRPQKTKELTNYNRIKREFGNYVLNGNEDVKLSLKNNQSEDNLRVKEKISGLKNYNHIEQTLGKIAKITKNEEGPEKTTASPLNFRESREEENRKASPDIQDIITGIVNILNRKGSKTSDVHPVRPNRPTSTRINNRGPPRISDVPPLDFDNPPPYRPLPPLPSKKIPLPYPFDLPPSMPNIPLPPQPQKPSASKLPSHPFIDGVPLPELVIPNVSTKKPSNLNNEFIQTGYDTISSSEPQNNKNFHSIIELNTTLKSEVPQSALENAHFPRNESISTIKNIYNSFNKSTISLSGNNTTKTDYNKVKPNGQKISPSSTFAKNPNKRVKPTPVSNMGDKPAQNKNSTSMSFIKGDKNKTEIIKVHTAVENKNITATENKSVVTTKNQNSNTTLTIEIMNNSKIVDIVDTQKNVLNTSTILIGETSKENLKFQSNTNQAFQTTLTKATESVQTTIRNETKKVEFDFDLPVLLEPSDGIGEATPVLETSIVELSLLPTEHMQTPILDLNIPTTNPTLIPESSSTQYKVRPGIVLDDPEYKPGKHKRPSASPRPIITAPPPNVHYGEIFDVTVHAIQGPGKEATGKPYIVPGEIDGIHVQNSQILKNDVSVITKPEDGQNFVSIDGKRTYINLFGDISTTKINPTNSQPHISGTGYIIPPKENPIHQSHKPLPSTSSPRRPPYKKPNHPPVRIDTCIVGDDTTCDLAQNEICKTEDGVSSCHCRPGYNRRKHRDTCRRVVSVLTSIRVDRLYDKKVEWQDNLKDPESEAYQQLSYEASQAIESAMSMTPFSDDFINSRINSIYSAKNLENNLPAVYVNLTIQLEENLDTVRPAVKQDIQRHLMRVIQRRNNNVGNSAVWVDAPPGSVLALQDVDECSSSELHDCHERAICLNTFGNFKCQCPEGLRDPWVGNIHREGRFCEACPSDFCNNRGECMFERGQQVCHCSGSFYGTQCEIDGEVLGVAIGASVTAAIIIILTLVCLCMWSRKWSKEQKSAVGVGMGSPVFGYMASGPTVKTPNVGAPPYQVTIEDRIRWAQIADVMAKANHYAQPEPVNTTSRSNFGGYSTLPAGSLPLPSIAPPVPLPRLSLANKPPLGTYGVHSQFGTLHQGGHGMRSSLETTSSSEEEDRTDLLGRNFNVPRPKSRASVANQSGIYYDVDYDRTDASNKQNTIPMNTYTLNPQHQVRPYFR